MFSLLLLFQRQLVNSITSIFVCQQLFFDSYRIFFCRCLSTKRRGWDSNPRALADKRFSRPPRYDHFDTSPVLVTFFLPNAKMILSKAFPFVNMFFKLFFKNFFYVFSYGFSPHNYSRFYFRLFMQNDY